MHECLARRTAGKNVDESPVGVTAPGYLTYTLDGRSETLIINNRRMKSVFES